MGGICLPLYFRTKATEGGRHPQLQSGYPRHPAKFCLLLTGNHRLPEKDQQKRCIPQNAGFQRNFYMRKDTITRTLLYGFPRKPTRPHHLLHLANNHTTKRQAPTSLNHSLKKHQIRSKSPHATPDLPNPRARKPTRADKGKWVPTLTSIYESPQLRTLPASTSTPITTHKSNPRPQSKAYKLTNKLQG